MAQLRKEDVAFYDGIAERICELLRDSRQDMTIATLAGRIGLNRSSLSRFLLRKTQTFPTHLLARTAGALKVSVGYLVSGNSDPEAKDSQPRDSVT